jgi:hypothetical protein
MKNFKSLILGSAAGVLAVAGAQAADLPVKAKPVEYVKVCSAYGAGFYYIPGTDICLRVGGFIYSEFQVNDRSHAVSSGVAARDRLDDWTSWRIRQALILDARTNTEYGTLRSYFVGGMQWDTAATGFPNNQNASVAPLFSTSAGQAQTSANWTWYYSAAFIQFAGFTFGIANSFFDTDPSTMINSAPGNSTPKSSPMIGYTAQLGSGISASVAVEDATLRRKSIQFGNLAANATVVSTTGQTIGLGGLNYGYASQYMPDIVANLRVDQAWGDAQIAGALHQVMTSTQQASPIGQINGAGEKWGYAFLGGLTFKVPQLGAGDTLRLQGVWAKGAVAYTDPEASNYNITGRTLSYRLLGNTFPNLTLMDAYVPGAGDGTGAATSLNLTKSYSIDTEYRHFWTANLRSSIGWTRYHQDTPSVANAAGFPDGTFDTVMGNLIWSPVKNLDLGTEVYWARLKTTNAFAGGNAATSTAGTPNGTESWWGGVFKATRYW